MALTTYMKSWQDFDKITLVQLPLFLFSATFFPVTAYDGALRWVVEATPLYRGVVLCRELTTGALSMGVGVVSVVYLVVMGGRIGLAVVRRRLDKLLLTRAPSAATGRRSSGRTSGRPRASRRPPRSRTPGAGPGSPGWAARPRPPLCTPSATSQPSRSSYSSRPSPAPARRRPGRPTSPGSARSRLGAVGRRVGVAEDRPVVGDQQVVARLAVLAEPRAPLVDRPRLRSKVAIPVRASWP